MIEFWIRIPFKLELVTQIFDGISAGDGTPALPTRVCSALCSMSGTWMGCLTPLFVQLKGKTLQ